MNNDRLEQPIWGASTICGDLSMGTNRVKIIQALHDKLSGDRKLSEPDIYYILEKWLERHPAFKGRGGGSESTGVNGLCVKASGQMSSRYPPSKAKTSPVMIQPKIETCMNTIWRKKRYYQAW